MLKKYECLKGYNTVQPEGETGCWVYFVMNSIFQGGASFQDGLHFGYYANEGGMYIGDFYTAKRCQWKQDSVCKHICQAQSKKRLFLFCLRQAPNKKSELEGIGYVL